VRFFVMCTSKLLVCCRKDFLLSNRIHFRPQAGTITPILGAAVLHKLNYFTLIAGQSAALFLHNHDWLLRVKCSRKGLCGFSIHLQDSEVITKLLLWLNIETKSCEFILKSFWHLNKVKELIMTMWCNWGICDKPENTLDCSVE